MKPHFILLLFVDFILSVIPSLADDWQTSLAKANEDLRAGNLDNAEDGFTTAQKLLEGAQTKSQDELKRNGMALVECIVGISKVKDRRGDASGSEQAYEMAMNTLKNFCEGGIKSQAYADYIPGIADLYERHGRIDQAELALKRVIEVRQTIPPKDDNKTIAAFDQYAKFLRGQKRNDEATVIENNAAQMRAYAGN
jgi:hypothetical protein